MAIAFDSVSSTLQSGDSPLTFSFTNTAGNFLAVVCDPQADTISSVTWNSTALTKAGTSQTNSGRASQIWYLENAETGTYNIVITGPVDIYARAISFSGVKTSSSVSGYTSSGATSSNPTLAVTTTANNSFVLVGGQVGATPSGGANTTQPSMGTNPQLAGFWYSTNAITPAGEFTANITASSTAWGIVGFAIAPSAGASLTASRGTFTLTGNNTTLQKAKVLIGSVLNVILTGYNVIMTQIGTHWTNESKNSSSWSNESKNTSTWSNQTKY